MTKFLRYAEGFGKASKFQTRFSPFDYLDFGIYL